MGTTNFSAVAAPDGFTGPLTGAVTATTAAATTSLTVGGGTAITKIVKGTIAIDPSSLTTFQVETLTLTITGAAVGDAVILTPAATGFTSGIMLSNPWVSSANAVKVTVLNATGGTLNESSATCDYTLIRS